MSEKEIGERVDSASDNFRIEKLFTHHPAKGTILQRVSKGVWALVLNTDSESVEKGQLKGQLRGQPVRHNKRHADGKKPRAPASDGASPARPGKVAPRRSKR